MFKYTLSKETVLEQWANKLIVLAAIIYSFKIRLFDTSLSMWELPPELTLIGYCKHHTFSV